MDTHNTGDSTLWPIVEYSPSPLFLRLVSEEFFSKGNMVNATFFLVHSVCHLCQLKLVLSDLCSANSISKWKELHCNNFLGMLGNMTD